MEICLDKLETTGREKAKTPEGVEFLGFVNGRHDKRLYKFSKLLKIEDYEQHYFTDFVVVSDAKSTEMNETLAFPVKKFEEPFEMSWLEIAGSYKTFGEDFEILQKILERQV